MSHAFTRGLRDKASKEIHSKDGNPLTYADMLDKFTVNAIVESVGELGD